jgi:hypothetical protein
MNVSMQCRMTADVDFLAAWWERNRRVRDAVKNMTRSRSEERG